MEINALNYVRIYQTAHSLCKYFGMDTSNAPDITQEVLITVLEVKMDPEKAGKIRNWETYIKGIVAKTILGQMRLMEKNDKLQDHLSYIFDKFDEADADLLKGQVKHAITLIDDYIKQYPHSLSGRCQQLWGLYKLGITDTSKLMNAMDIPNLNTFYSIKKRLVSRIIMIYKSQGSPG